MATRIRASRTQAVIIGRVRITMLNTARIEKAPFCSQMLRNTLGNRRPDLEELLFLFGPSTALFCSHSPGIGIGQMAHHPRPKNGTATRIKAAHQAIHTATMLILRFPTGVPKKPARMAIKNPPRRAARMINCGQRLLTQKLKPGRLFKDTRVTGGTSTHQPELPERPTLHHATLTDWGRLGVYRS